MSENVTNWNPPSASLEPPPKPRLLRHGDAVFNHQSEAQRIVDRLDKDGTRALLLGMDGSTVGWADVEDLTFIEADYPITEGMRRPS